LQRLRELSSVDLFAGHLLAIVSRQVQVLEISGETLSVWCETLSDSAVVVIDSDCACVASTFAHAVERS